jgi:hypothetical protein
MSLVLKQHNADDPDQYHVMHGELEVGEIYKRKVSLRPETAWLWALNGVPVGSAGLAFTGLAATLDDAMGGLRESWSRWLSSAELLQADASGSRIDRTSP